MSEQDNIFSLPRPDRPPEPEREPADNPVIAALESALAFARENPELVNGAALVILTENEGASGLVTYWGRHDHVSPYAVLGAAQSLAHDLACEFTE